MKAVLVVAGVALAAWVAQWSFAPVPAVRTARVEAPRVALVVEAPPAPTLAAPARTIPTGSDLDAAIADGRWTEADRELLVRTLAALPDDQKADVLAKVQRAINAGHLVLDAPIL